MAHDEMRIFREGSVDDGKRVAEVAMEQFRRLLVTSERSAAGGGYGDTPRVVQTHVDLRSERGRRRAPPRVAIKNVWFGCLVIARRRAAGSLRRLAGTDN